MAYEINVYFTARVVGGETMFTLKAKTALHSDLNQIRFSARRAAVETARNQYRTSANHHTAK